SYWAGMLAALLFLASPFENQYTYRSVYYISQLWFAVLAFGFFVCVVDNFKGRPWNYLSYLFLGVLAMVGRGWRVDVLLLVPFFFAALILTLAVRHRSWKVALAGGCLFLMGAGLTNFAIDCLCPGRPQSSMIAFHTALYGDATRCNMMGLENSFQIARCDLQTRYNAF